MKMYYLGCQIKHDNPEAMDVIDQCDWTDKTYEIDVVIHLPTSEEIYQMMGYRGGTPHNPTVEGFNRHKCEWKSYVGFTESYDYCDCGAKK